MAAPPAAAIIPQAYALLLLTVHVSLCCSTLACAIYLLASNPAAEAQLLQEVDAFGRGNQPTYEDMAQFPFAEVGQQWVALLYASCAPFAHQPAMLVWFTPPDSLQHQVLPTDCLQHTKHMATRGMPTTRCLLSLHCCRQWCRRPCGCTHPRP